MSYLLRRAALAALRIVAISVLAFFLFELAPGDFYSGEQWDPRTREATLSAWRARQGMDRPAFARFAGWAGGLLRGDLGVSMAYGMPVARLLGERAGKTAMVLAPALGLSWAIGLLLAFWVVRRRKLGLWAPAATVWAMLPEVIVASLLLFAAIGTGMPVGGAWLPVTALVLGMTPVVFLHAARGLDEASRLPFVKIAESRGIESSRLWAHFILPAAANPLISLAGLSLAGGLSASLVMEAMTGWPGVGPLFFEAVHGRDYPVVQAVVVMLGAVLTVSNLAADALLYRLDPRLRGADEANR